MAAQELFTVSLEPNPLECWDNESTASALRALAVRLHSTGIPLRETAAALEQFGVTRSHQAVWQWVHRTAETAPDPPTAKPSRVAVDETAVKIGTEQHWLYTAIDVELFEFRNDMNLVEASVEIDVSDRDVFSCRFE